MTTTIELIKNLREITGAGVLECRTALEANQYSYEAALADLKELSRPESRDQDRTRNPAGPGGRLLAQ